MGGRRRVDVGGEAQPARGRAEALPRSAELEYATARQRRFLEPETQPVYLADHDRVEACRREKERLRERHPRGEGVDAPLEGGDEPRALGRE